MYILAISDNLYRF